MRHGQIGDHKIKSRRPRLEFANHLPGSLEPAHRKALVAELILEPGLRRLRAEPFRLVAPHAEHRCPAEPTQAFAAKGGADECTEGRKCLCNGLLAAVGLGQTRPAATPGQPPVDEPPILTAGAETATIARFLAPGADYCTARDVINQLLGPRTDQLSAPNGRRAQQTA